MIPILFTIFAIGLDIGFINFLVWTTHFHTHNDYLIANLWILGLVWMFAAGILTVLIGEAWKNND